MTRLLILAMLAVPAVVFAAHHSATSSHPDLSGVAHVIDGDTIIINDTHIRLWGVDAVERHQTCESATGLTYECGQDATAVLKELTRDQRVNCIPRDRDRYNRVVAVCYTESVELNAEMVRRGWAVDYRSYDRECRYCKEEAAAKAEHLGIWSGRFEMPVEWRREHNR